VSEFNLYYLKGQEGDMLPPGEEPSTPKGRPGIIEQYTCPCHRFEVRKGGKCCWCQLEDARRHLDTLVKAVQEHMLKHSSCDTPDDYDPTSGSCVTCDWQTLCAAAKDAAAEAAKNLTGGSRVDPVHE